MVSAEVAGEDRAVDLWIVEADVDNARRRIRIGLGKAGKIDRVIDGGSGRQDLTHVLPGRVGQRSQLQTIATGAIGNHCRMTAAVGEDDDASAPWARARTQRDGDVEGFLGFARPYDSGFGERSGDDGVLAASEPV